MMIYFFFIGWLPGLFHAFYVIYKYRDETIPAEERPTVYGGSRPTYGESRPETVKIHSTTTPPPPSKQAQPIPQNNPPQTHPYQEHNPTSNKKENYPPAKYPHNSVAAEPSHEGLVQTYPPSYDNHRNDEKLEGGGDDKKKLKNIFKH